MSSPMLLMITLFLILSQTSGFSLHSLNALGIAPLETPTKISQEPVASIKSANVDNYQSSTENRLPDGEATPSPSSPSSAQDSTTIEDVQNTPTLPLEILDDIYREFQPLPIKDSSNKEDEASMKAVYALPFFDVEMGWHASEMASSGKEEKKSFAAVNLKRDAPLTSTQGSTTNNENTDLTEEQGTTTSSIGQVSVTTNGEKSANVDNDEEKEGSPATIEQNSTVIAPNKSETVEHFEATTLPFWQDSTTTAKEENVRSNNRSGGAQLPNPKDSEIRKDGESPEEVDPVEGEECDIRATYQDSLDECCTWSSFDFDPNVIDDYFQTALMANFNSMLMRNLDLVEFKEVEFDY